MSAIQLKNGRTMSLVSILQERTYCSYLELGPNPEYVGWILEEKLKRCQRVIGPSASDEAATGPTPPELAGRATLAEILGPEEASDPRQGWYLPRIGGPLICPRGGRLWESNRVREDSKKSISVRLPQWACMADFHSAAARHDDADYSTLSLVWFQSHPALPIADNVLAWMQELDWEAWAEDCWL